MKRSSARLTRTLLALTVLGLGVTACTQATNPGTSASLLKPSGSSSGQSAESGSVTPDSAGPSRAACTSGMLLKLRHTFEGGSPGAGTPDVRVERCTNSYARVFSPEPGGEQYYLRYLDGSWHVVAEGTGLDCADPDASRALLRACTALGYPTSVVPGRVSSPQVVADRLVQAWMRHDSTAAGQLTRSAAPVESLFSEQAPGVAPTPIPCRLFSLGQFVCSYTLAPRAEVTMVVEGGASAGYLVTGIEFGD